MSTAFGSVQRSRRFQSFFEVDMMRKALYKITSALLALLLIAALCGCAGKDKTQTRCMVLSDDESVHWEFGFGKKQIVPDENDTQPLYIAGYNSAMEISGILDYCEAKALWIGTGDDGILLIGVDCIALDSGTVRKIREGLSEVSNCAAVHVYSTHSHASADTLGLWGETAIGGKNDSYMNRLIEAAVSAGKEAASAKKTGSLYYGYVETDPEEMLRDSRLPYVFDSNLYQLRFVPEDGSSGVRMYFYCAHAESLRSINSKLSRDYPGVLCDGVKAKTGDDAMFLPGAVGGLLMTKEFVETNSQENAERNLEITGDKMIRYALSVTSETKIEPSLRVGTSFFSVPLDNPDFLLFRFLGLLSNKAVKGSGATGYAVETELSVLQLGDISLLLVPGEIFPELVYGGGELHVNVNSEAANPKPLCEIAEEAGIEKLLIVGLANDELGYIVTPTDFLLNEEKPYLEKTMDYKGENHYEETNSVGPDCASCIAKAFEDVLTALQTECD